MHLIYAVLAVLLLGLFSMGMSRSIRHTETKMVLNEVLTELTGAGYEVIDFIGRQPFDENTDESKKTPLTYPVITGTGQLTSFADFGGCTTLALATPSCDDIDDFHDLNIDMVVDGLTYTVTVAVRYVDPASPDNAAVGNSLAKEVELTISNPYLLVGGQPLQVRLARVFTYNRHIS